MNGVINLIKPKGISSFRCVSEIKKMTGIKKVGHTGTLDPEAEGVLPICIGKATKIIDYIMTNNKEYEAELKLGVITDTYDLEGKVIEENEYSSVTETLIRDTIKTFVGEIAQVPPMYSALKKDGVRLYELARKGIEIEREARNVTIYKIEVISINIPFIKIRVKCSKGTYIRSLCYDIGKKLGTGAVMTDLKRIANGKFQISDGIELSNLNKDNIQNYIISIDDALNFMPLIHVKGYFDKLLVNGVKVKNKKFTDDNIKKDILYRVYNYKDEFIGIGSYNGESFKIEKLLL